MRSRDPNSVSGVKIDVLGGSRWSVALTAAFLTVGDAFDPARGWIAATRPGPS